VSALQSEFQICRNVILELVLRVSVGQPPYPEKTPYLVMQ
jgi:hypothetical protein